MAKGNGIIVTPYPNGRKKSVIVSGTPKPGTIMQIQAGTAVDGNGHHTYEAYDRDADGDRPRGPFAVLLHDDKQGKTVNDAYVSGTLGEVYFPLPGDELNLLFKNISGTGTGDELDEGDIMIVDDGTGKLIRATGSSESPGSLECEPFIALEAVEDVTADTLVWSQFSGY